MVSVTISDELTKLKSNFFLLTFDQELSLQNECFIIKDKKKPNRYIEIEYYRLPQVTVSQTF